VIQKACEKCGLIQLWDIIWGLCICDSKEALLWGCPPKEKVLEIQPDWEYDETAIIPPPKTRPYFISEAQKELIDSKMKSHTVIFFRGRRHR
jgi:hypothetical protein